MTSLDTAKRRILRIDSSGVTVARAARFESEQQLHDAIAAHPEALPHEDFGLTPLIPLATRIDLGSGPMALLAADAERRLVIVEFRRGTENSDVRQVVAQILDYGASLWRTSYATLEEECVNRASGSAASLTDIAAHRLEFPPSDYRGRYPRLGLWSWSVRIKPWSRVQHLSPSGRRQDGRG